MNPNQNPVIFPEMPASEDLTVYANSLSEFRWKNRLVGLTESGFLYVDERVARKGYYEFYPKVLDWDEVQEVKIGRYVDVLGFLLGSIGLGFGLFVLYMDLIKQRQVESHAIGFPLAIAIGGAIFTFGALRNHIVVVSDGVRYRWNSLPLKYRRTLSLCDEATTRCHAHRVPLVSSRFEPGG